MQPQQKRLRRIGLGFAIALLVGGWGCAESRPPLADDTGSGVDGGDAAPLPGTDTTDEGEGDAGTACDATRCTPGASRCAGPESVVTCEEGPSGCPFFTSPRECPENLSCVEGECIEENDCRDSDNDGYGDGCEAGPDCDDSDPDINPGAEEICGDGIDNNCKNGVDENCGPDCSNQPCNPGQTRCTTGGDVEVCEEDSDGCGTWSDPSPCPNGTCKNGQCESCIDNDGDGYGMNCSAGTDCDDSDDTINPGAPEVCDGVDHDCDGDTDEDFSRLGDTCTVGRGACEASGTYVCNSSGSSTTCDAQRGSPEPEKCGDGIDNDCDGDTDEGFGAVGSSCQRGTGECSTSGTLACDPNDPTMTYCDAPQPTSGSTEVCDNKDNDCDGDTDENGVCSTCNDDRLEDNDDQTTASDLTSAQTIEDLRSCGTCGSGADDDWFTLGSRSTGTSVTVELRQPLGTNANGTTHANLEIEMFCDGHLCDSIRGRQSPMTGTFDGTCAPGFSDCSSPTEWTFYVYPRCTDSPDGNPTIGTPYEIERK